MGKKVCVLEQHYTAGGYTHAYWRKGFEWDVGVHYIGEVHKEYSTLRRIFDVISQGRLQWAEMDKVYDKICIGDEEFDFVAGKDNFIESLVANFPKERQAIEHYVELIRLISKQSSTFFAGQALPPMLAKLYNKIRPKLVHKAFFKTAREVLEEITSNQKLISVLCGQWGDYGMVPRDASFLIHALIAKHYLAGAAYPVGGASSIARAIIPTIENAGGHVFTMAKVEQVLIHNNKAYGVQLAGGHKLYADKIISNIGFMNTVNHIMPPSVKTQYGMDNWTNKVTRSSASICLYAGFNQDAQSLNLKKTNLWLYPNEHIEANVDAYRTGETSELPLTYISFPSVKDPDWDNRYPGKATVEIVSLASMDDYQDWFGTTWNDRGDSYLQLKEKLSQILLKSLFKREPQLEQALEFYELSTPLSTQFYQRNDGGEIYGVNHSVDRFKQSFLHPQTPIKNFYMTGSDVLTAGVGGALMGGVMTTMRMQGVFGMNKVKKLLKAGVSQ